jgi:8-oxo-dGTP pyrophosphatase MutT (NUDIX family)
MKAASNDTITCTSLYGKPVEIAREKIIYRPAVYGLIVHDNRMLMVRTRSTGKLYLPGGGIELGERVEDALHREVYEETGLRVRIQRFNNFKEDFFYYDPWDQAYHGLLFFYVCQPLTFDLCEDNRIEDEESSQPRWMSLEEILDEPIQSHGDIILPAARQLLYPTPGIEALP